LKREKFRRWHDVHDVNDDDDDGAGGGTQVGVGNLNV